MLVKTHELCLPSLWPEAESVLCFKIPLKEKASSGFLRIVFYPFVRAQHHIIGFSFPLQLCAALGQIKNLAFPVFPFLM